jgi:hypothetical protein
MRTGNFIFTALMLVCFATPTLFSQISDSSKPEIPKKLIDVTSLITVSGSQASFPMTKRDGGSFSLPITKITLPSYMEIEDVHFDTSLNMFIILSSKTGRPSVFKPIYLLAYNPGNNQTVWGKQFHFGKGVEILPTNDQCVLRVKNLSGWENFSFAKQSGQMIWRNDFELRNMIPSEGIAFNGSIDCIDLSTGVFKWSRKAKNDYGALGEFMYNGKIFSIMDGIHCLNINDGSGWDFYCPMGKKETGELAADIMGSVFAVTLYKTTGIDYISEQAASTSRPQIKTTGYPESHAVNYSGGYTRTGLSSNILFQDGKIYFSANNRLLCLENSSGKKIWEQHLPDERTGNTFITSTGEKLFLFNRGICYRDKTISSYFVPYLSIIDKQTGTILCNRSINVYGDPISDFLIVDSLIYILTSKDLRVNNMTCFQTKKLSSSPDSLLRNVSGNFQSFLKEEELMDYFLPSSSQKTNYRNLTSLKNEGVAHFLRCEKGIVCFDSNMHQNRWIPEADLLIRRTRVGDISVLSSPKKFITTQTLIDDRADGDLLFQFNPLCRTEIINGCLIFISQGNTFSFIPLTELATLAHNQK